MTTYEKNIAAIKELYPGLHQWIIDQPDVDFLKPDGPDQLYVTAGSVNAPMYDVNDPMADIKEVDNMPLHKENVTFILGVGLGHTLNRICEKMEDGHHVVAIEPVGHMMRLCLGRYDLSKYIEKRQLFFAPGKGEVDMLIGQFETFKSVEDWLVLVDKSTRLRSEYNKIIDYTIELLNQVQCNTGTVVSSGAKIADNDIATLPWVIRHRGAAELAGLFAGKPAVCVSTGPSLERNIHLLKDVQDKIIIIAVAQALRPLLAYDIRPDFICTVDFGIVNASHFEGLYDESIPLVTINKTYAPLLKAYKGPKFISAGTYAEGSTHSVLNEMGELPQGGSVAHMVFGLAAVLGCNPIILIGQNLALE